MSGELLEVRDLAVGYRVGETVLRAFQGVDLTISPGEIVGVVGESGCGKSSLALSLLRLLPPNGDIPRGQIMFEGRDLLQLSPEEMRGVRGAEIGLVFQDARTSLNPLLTVGQMMRDADRAHDGLSDLSKSALRDRHTEALGAVGIPDPRSRLGKYPHEFSGGQLQRALIAQALLQEPRLLVADEPTSSLDVTLEAQILDLLSQLRNDHNIAIMFVSHSLAAITHLCDRVVVMYAGRVLEEIDADAVFDHPQHPYTRALVSASASASMRGRKLATIPGRVPVLFDAPVGCTFADRCPLVKDLCRTHEPLLQVTSTGLARCHVHDPAHAFEWSTADLDRSVAPSATEVAGHPAAVPPATPRAQRVVDDPLVEIAGLKTYFRQYDPIIARATGNDLGPVRAVDDVSLVVQRGEILGLVGESGSGKTTVGQTILRLVPATAGRISFDGEDVQKFKRRRLREFRANAQMIFQDPYSSLSPRMRVDALVNEPYALSKVPAEERKSTEELLTMVGLSPELATKYPHQLSGGQARRVGIARALALDPAFVVADEPTSGLDASSAAAVLNLMVDLRDRLNLTYLIITHDLGLVAYMADRIAVMYLGEIVELGRTDQVYGQPAHPYTQALLATEARGDDPDIAFAVAQGEIPSPRNPPPGCRFHTRCAFAQDRCRTEHPAPEPVDSGHVVSCHYWREVRSMATGQRSYTSSRKLSTASSARVTPSPGSAGGETAPLV